MNLEFRPPLFMLTALGWLVLSSLLGLVLFLGILLGMPLPPSWRVLHVHGALIGGVAQIIMGALLAFIPALLMTGRDRPTSHPVLFSAINGGAVAILVGFWLKLWVVIAAAGLLVVLAFVTLLGEGLRQAKLSLSSPPLNLWFYGVAVVLLLAGLGVGVAMALQFIPGPQIPQARLVHIHLNLIGFVTLTIIGTMHNLFPTVLNTRLHNFRLTQVTFVVLPAGVLGLVGGFLMSHPQVQIGAGGLLLAGTLLYGYNMLRTWMDAGRPNSIVSNHFIMATLFLLLAVIAGILVSVNALWDPPAIPFGTLHLMAYTHLALVGFILQTIIGALSHLLPIILAVERVKSNKKRGPFLAELNDLIERWQVVQVGALNLGTIVLGVVAALVWDHALGSLPVQIAAWLAAGLLLAGLLAFVLKIGLILTRRPPI